MFHIPIEPLTAGAFAPFGDVVETTGAPLIINAGYAQRFNDLAAVDISPEAGEPCVSIFTARARALPLTITMMERHPLGSQAFMPLQNNAWMIIVCESPEEPASYRAFAATGLQGVNYARGTWHFPLVTFHDGDRFMVVDRKGPGNNLDERFLQPGTPIVVSR